MSQLFLNQLTRGFHLCKDSDSLTALRMQGWTQFETLGLPDRNNEAYRYVSLRGLYQQNWTLGPIRSISKEEFKDAIDPASLHSHLVFVNGFLRLDLSDLTALPPQIQIMGLDDAMRSHASFLSHRLSKSIREEKDPFAALNLSLHGKGVFLYVPPRIQLKDPIQCVDVTVGDEIFASPRIHLFIGAQSEITWTTSLAVVNATDSVHCCNAFIDLALEEGAQCRFYRGLNGSNQQWSFTALRATLKKESCLKSVTLSGRGICSRQNDVVALIGPGAEAHVQGLTVLNNSTQAHAHLVMDHQAPHTQSMQKFKTIAQDHAQASFEGKILVRAQAQQTQAYQLNNNLILDGRALVNSKPNLEIFADDVKASHGVTVSQLDPHLLFYFKTRGVSESTAKQLLTAGFCQEILKEMPNRLAQEMQMRLTSIQASSVPEAAGV